MAIPLLGRMRAAFKAAGGVSMSDPRIADVFGVRETASGRSVSRATAMQASAVLACVRVIAEGVAGLPLHAVIKDSEAHEIARGTREEALLHERPTDTHTSAEFRELLTASAALTGDGYALKVRVGGEVRELVPLLPQWVSVNRQARPMGRPLYHVNTPYQITGTFEADDIFHVRGPLLGDDFYGSDMVRHAREAIGLALGTEETHASLHRHGVRPSGLLSTDKPLAVDAIRALRDHWAETFAGSGNTGKTPILDNGWKYTPFSMTGVDAQHLETRRFQIEEVCRFFGVFPQMIMAGTNSSTAASAEAFFAAHLPHTVNPWLVRWRGALNRDVLGWGSPLCAHFDTAQFSKATLSQRGEFISRMVQLGVMTRNDARKELGLPPLDGLDEPLTPGNVVPGNIQADATTAPDEVANA